MKLYPAYKDSGIEWIGKIAEHWNLTKLKFISSINTGNKDTVDRDDNGKYPFFVRSQTPERINTYSFDGEAILTAGDGDIGKIFHYYNGKFDYHQRVYKISNFEKVDGKFVYYYMMSKFYDAVIGLSAKSTVDSLRLPMLLDFPVVVGTIQEQQLIVKFLDKKTSQIDSIIEKKQKEIELLKEEHTAIINQAVTEGLNPDVPMKDSGIEWIGKIPEHWNVSKLGFLANVKARLGWKGLKASEYIDEGYIFLSTPNIKSTDIDFENVNYISSERYYESPEIMLEEGDVLIAKDGSTLGITNVVRKLPAPATVNSSIAVIRPKAELNSIFLYHFLSSHYTQNVIQLFKGGMGVPHLFQADLKKFIVIVPPSNEQKLISEYLDLKNDETKKLIENAEKQISFLQEYRTALISNAVTGKIDVRNYQ